MLNNCGPRGSPPNSATLMGVIQTPGWMITLVTGEEACPLCQEAHGSKSELKETDATRADAKLLAKTLSRHNESAEPSKRFPKGKYDSGRMLGVVRCLCDQVYSDHSGETESVFRQLVKDKHGWHVPEQRGSYVPDSGQSQPAEEEQNRRKSKVERFTEKLCARQGNDLSILEEQWKRADHLFLQYKETQDSAIPARFPPGVCAGPKALALALDNGALLSGITERWFHRGKSRTGSKVEHLRSNDDIPTARSFGHGESVPPCASCNIILPLLLCTKGKDSAEQCQHPVKKA